MDKRLKTFLKILALGIIGRLIYDYAFCKQRPRIVEAENVKVIENGQREHD